MTAKRYKEIELLASASRIASVNSSSVDTHSGDVHSEGGNARAFLDVTVVTGTSPTLDIDIEGLINNIWYVIGSFTQAAAVVRETIILTSLPKTARAACVIGGASPDFTFEVQLVKD